MEVINATFVGDDDNITVYDNINALSLSNTQNTTEPDYSRAKKHPQIIAAQAAAFGAFLLGTSFGWSSPVQPQLQQQSLLNSEPQNSTWYINLDDDEMSWVGSLLNIGALFGAITGGFLMDKFGRRIILMVMSLPFVTGWLLIALAVDPSMFYIGRIVVGYAGGVCSAIIPCFVGEISTPPMRGVVGFLYSLNLASGLLLTSIVGLWLNWRWITGICALNPLIYFLGLLFIPESPYFLVKNGQTRDAVKSLEWLRGSKYNVQEELHQIETRVHSDKNHAVRFSDISYPWAYKPVLIGIILMILQQFSGMNAASFNSAEIFRIAELSFDRLVGVILINTVQVIAVVLSSCFLVKRLNRKTLFVISEGLVCLAMIALGGFFYFNNNILNLEDEVTSILKWLPLASLIIFFAGIGLGVGGLPWLISSEILPAKFRGPGSSFNAFTNFAASFIVTKTFVNMQREMTHAGVFWFYSGVAFVGMLFGVFFLPETKGKTYKQIDALFMENKEI